jgi:threonine dehydratase
MLDLAKKQYMFNLGEVREAFGQLQKYPEIVYRTELQEIHYLSRRYECRVLLKREDKQRCKLYKIRGGLYSYLQASEEQREKGFVTASDGNFAQVMCELASVLNFRLTVFIPTVCQVFKVDHMKKVGKDRVEINRIGLNFYDCLPHAMEYASKTGMAFLHPFNDLDIIIGNATIAYEISDDFSDPVDYVLVPSGGGSLLSSISAYFKQISKKTKTVCV